MEPEPPRPRRSHERAELGPFGRTLLRAGVGMTLGALVLILLDVLLGVRLPQPFRMALPLVLAVGLFLALAVGVSAFGAPRRPGGDPVREDEGAPP